MNNEAFERAKSAYGTGAYDDATMEFIFPQLRESKDERIRKYLIEELKAAKPVGELKFVIPQPTREECIAYLEKQKDVSKAIEAVERIDKYIDERLANAHDMKDSNPDKKYYRGWDDALGKMAGILQDVYSGEKKKESLRDFIDDFPYSDQKEQKPAEYLDKDMVYAIMTKLTNLSYSTLIPINSDEYKKLHEITSDVRSLLDYPIEQKPAEWSDTDNIGWDEAFACVTKTERAAKDEEELQNAVTAEKWLKEIKFKYCVHPVKQEWSEDIIRKAVKEVGLTQHQINWFETNVFPPKQEWSEEDRRTIDRACVALRAYANGELPDILPSEILGYADKLQSLRPHWKPSEEQMGALSWMLENARGNIDFDPLKELYEQLKKL